MFKYLCPTIVLNYHCFWFLLLLLVNARLSRAFNMGNFTKQYQFSPDRFGSYYVTTRSLEKCNGSKTMDEDNYLFTNVYVRKVSRMDEEYKGYVNVKNDVQVIEGILNAYLVKGNRRTNIFERNPKQPCKDVVFSTIASFFLKVDGNCVIKMNNYTIGGVDMNKVTHMLIGEYFVYEVAEVYLELFSKKGSIVCLQIMLETKQYKGKRGPARGKPLPQNNITSI